MKFLATILLITSINAYAWKGVQITEVSQLEEVAHFSTAFGYVSESLPDLKNMLDINDGRMMPIIEISRYFWNPESGVFSQKDATPLLDALGKHKIIMMLDEPFWWIRQACQAGKQLACSEISSNYSATRQLFKDIKLASGFQMLHVEAFAEFNIQKTERPGTNVTIVEAADHIAFDCYGALDNCGGRHQFEYAAWLYDAMLPHQKIFLVPGAFNFASDDIVISQLEEYFTLYNNYRSIISGIGIFTWGDFDGLIGAKNIPVVRDELIRLLNLSY